MLKPHCLHQTVLNSIYVEFIDNHCLHQTVLMDLEFETTTTTFHSSPREAHQAPASSRCSLAPAARRGAASRSAATLSAVHHVRSLRHGSHYAHPYSHLVVRKTITHALASSQRSRCTSQKKTLCRY